ncbi:MAG: hypothetical protein WCT16_04350 [Candidatus Buchananbacteria bacterium]
MKDKQSFQLKIEKIITTTTQKCKKYWQLVKIALVFAPIIIFLFFSFLWPTKQKCFLTLDEPPKLIDESRRAEYIIDNQDGSQTLTKKGMLANWGYTFDEDALEYWDQSEGGDNFIIKNDYFYKYSAIKGIVDALSGWAYDFNIYDLYFYNNTSKIKICRYNSTPTQCRTEVDFNIPFYASFGWGNDPIEDLDFKNTLIWLSPTSTPKHYEVNTNKKYKISITRGGATESEAGLYLKKEGITFDSDNEYLDIEREASVCLKTKSTYTIARNFIFLLFYYAIILNSAGIYNWVRKKEQ